MIDLSSWLSSLFKAGVHISTDNLPTGAEWDRCKICDVRRKEHSYDVQGHHFKEE